MVKKSHLSILGEVHGFFGGGAWISSEYLDLEFILLMVFVVLSASLNLCIVPTVLLV